MRRSPTLIITRATLGRAAASAARRDGRRRRSPCPTSAGRRCDIKTVRLLPNLLAKTGGARKAGRLRGLAGGRGRLCHRGRLDQRLDRRPRRQAGAPATLSHDILPGVTRRVILEAAARGADCRSWSANSRRRRPWRRERPYHRRPRARRCRWCAIDGDTIGDGKPGPLTRRIHDALCAKVRRTNS